MELGITKSALLLKVGADSLQVVLADRCLQPGTAGGCADAGIVIKCESITSVPFAPAAVVLR